MTEFDPSIFDDTPSTTKPKASSGGSTSASDLLDQIDKRQKQQTKAVKAASSARAIQAGDAAEGGGIDLLSVLSAVPASLAALTTPDDYLVGRRNATDPKVRTVGDMSLVDQILGPDQLSLADPLKALFTDTKDQQDYLAGTEDLGGNLKMKGLETLGLVGDIIFDPINLIGGAGMYDDGIKLMEKGTKVESMAKYLAERAATDGADSFAAKGAALLDNYHSVIDDIDALGLDEAEALAQKTQAGIAARAAYGQLNGEALVEGEHILNQAKYLPTKVVEHAPTSQKLRTGAAQDRVQDMLNDVSSHLGVSAEEVQRMPLPVFGGRTAVDVVRDVGTRGFPGIEASAKEAMGVTGRLWRGNLADVFTLDKNRSAFNPFATSASVTSSDLSKAMHNTPASFIRRAAIGEITTENKLGQKGLDIMTGFLQPGYGRSGQLWRAALERMSPNAKANERALRRVARQMGTTLESADAGAWANYPLTVLSQARLDGIINAAGKALTHSSRSAQKAISTRLMKEVETNPEAWRLIGSDIVPSSVWGDAQQAIFNVVDGADATAGKGSIKERLAEALHAAMKRADVPVDIMALDREGQASDITLKVFRDLIADPEFTTAIKGISTDWAERMAKEGMTEGDLVRASMNALTNTVSISKETDGVFSWIEALARAASAKELFTPQGADVIGREAKILNYLEEMGLAVVARNPEGGLTTAEIHATINETADRITFGMKEHREAFEDLLQRKADLLDGLRQRGATEAQITKLSEEMDSNALDQENFRVMLKEAMSDAGAAEDMDAIEMAKVEKRLLADVEKTAVKLEETHLAILDYRDLDESAKAAMVERRNAADAVERATLQTQRIKDTIHSLIDDVPADVPGNPPGDSRFKSGTSRAASIFDFVASTDPTKADKAGSFWGSFNSPLSYARRVFGDSMDLEVLARHAETTRNLTQGYDQTRGFVNRATVAEWFNAYAPEEMQKFADENGGWLEIFMRQDPEQLDEIKRLGEVRQRTVQRYLDKALTWEEEALAAGNPITPELTAKIEGLRANTQALKTSSLGIEHTAFAEFTFGTLADGINAVQPVLDDVIRYMSTGEGYERVLAGFAGENGTDVLNQLENGDLTFLSTFVEKVGRSIDLGIGVSGGFGDAGKYSMIRSVINDPQNEAMKMSFKRLLTTVEDLEASAIYMRSRAEAEELLDDATAHLDAILEVTPSIKRLEGTRGALVEKLNLHNLPEMARKLKITEAEAAQAKEFITATRRQVATIERRLASMERRGGQIATAHSEALTRLAVQDGQLAQLEELVAAGNISDIATAMRMHRELAVLDSSSMMSTLLSGSKDFTTIQRGLDHFFEDPAVRFYQNGAGETVRRTDDQVGQMWVTKLRKAEAYIERMAKNATEGHETAAGNWIPGIDQYTEHARIQKEWLTDRGAEGFNATWRGAAIKDDSAAHAFISIATQQAGASPSQYRAAWDMVLGMFKAGYVGTLSFAPRNLTGALIENARQGVKFSVTKDVWAADSIARRLNGMALHASTLDGAEKEAAQAAVDRMHVQARKLYGADLFDAVYEARSIGIAESNLFSEIAGQSVEGTPLSFVGAVKQAWTIGGQVNRSKFGDEAVFSTLGSVTSAMSKIPGHPSSKYEGFIGRHLEAGARGGDWSKITAGLDSAEVDLLETAAKQYTATPGVESLVRIDLFVQRRLAGDTPEQAFGRVMDSHFDYSDLSGFDRNMRSILPFWIWKSRSIAHTGEMFMHRPGIAQSTMKVWSTQHRSKDPRAPRYTLEPGGGFDPGIGLGSGGVGLAIADPTNDFLTTLDQLTGTADKGVAQSLVADANPLLALPFELNSGVNSEGIPIDTSTSVQGPMDTLAKNPVGEAFVGFFAYRKENGKWYWRSPEAAHAIGEVIPLLNNVTKITTPMTDGGQPDDAAYEQWMEKLTGTLLRNVGAPVRAVPVDEQTRAADAYGYNLRREMEESGASSSGGRGGSRRSSRRSR